MRVTPVVAALTALMLVACARDAPPVSDHYPALGTVVDVTIRGVAPDAEAEAFRALRAGFADAHRDWHAWNDGDLARYNAARAGGMPVPTAPGLDELLDRAVSLHELSGGLFEPRLGALVEAWGFHDPSLEAAAPPADAIDAWLAGGLRQVVDLGGIAKGAAVAEALARLRDLGVRHALVNAGGDVAVLGDAGGRAWRIGIRNPRGVGVIGGVALASGEALFTSGDYERGYAFDGTRYHHLLDPRTGWPATGTASVTVLHDDPVLADAAATALFVAGDDWAPVAAAMGVACVLRIADDGAVSLTTAMADRVRFENPAPQFTVIDALAAPR